MAYVKKKMKLKDNIKFTEILDKSNMRDLIYMEAKIEARRIRLLQEARNNSSLLSKLKKNGKKDS